MPDFSAQPSKTSVRTSDFVCSGPEEHDFRCFIKSDDRPDGFSVLFMPVGTSNWSTMPVCPVADCPGLGRERNEAFSTDSMVPESERVVVWMSPDGKWASIPGRTDAAMPQRYVTAGYKRVEAKSLADLERIQEIRAKQTGNHVYNEMAAFDAYTRRVREEAEYSDDPTVDV